MSSPTSVLTTLLPAAVVTVETRDDRVDIKLLPEERLALGGAAPKRRREFVTGRACARDALAQLGLPRTSIGRGGHGEPLWPSGVVGSITHCEGYCACAAASSGGVLALGIDAEYDAPLLSGVWEQVAHGRERGLRDPYSSGTHLDAVLFSAKEATYKAWFPLTRRWLGFDDVELSIDVVSNTFRAYLLVPGPKVGCTQLTELVGRWATLDGMIVTAVAVTVMGAR